MWSSPIIAVGFRIYSIKREGDQGMKTLKGSVPGTRSNFKDTIEMVSSLFLSNMLPLLTGANAGIRP